jgi:NAD(P)-dependent dehydrogenase (short-subunit alcohol dehydrogenase family)
MSLVLITGISTGIGRATAELFAREGWQVVGTARNPDKVADVEWPGDVALEPFDLDVEGDAERLAADVLERYGCPDVLINNAGMLQFGPIEEMPREEMERIFRVNVFEQIALAYGFVPAMRERGCGTIVNVTSLGGRMVFPFFAVYNSSKHALEGFSEGMWHELKPFGIRVKAVEPGFVETAIWDKVLGEAAGEKPEAYAEAMEGIEEFETKISSRTSPEDAAQEVWDAVMDPSDTLRYPIAAYARQILRGRRVLGDQYMLRFFHKRWFGADDVFPAQCDDGEDEAESGKE